MRRQKDFKFEFKRKEPAVKAPADRNQQSLYRIQTLEPSFESNPKISTSYQKSSYLSPQYVKPFEGKDFPDPFPVKTPTNKREKDTVESSLKKPISNYQQERIDLISYINLLKEKLEIVSKEKGSSDDSVYLKSEIKVLNKMISVRDEKIQMIQEELQKKCERIHVLSLRIKELEISQNNLLNRTEKDVERYASNDLFENTAMEIRLKVKKAQENMEKEFEKLNDSMGKIYDRVDLTSKNVKELQIKCISEGIYHRKQKEAHEIYGKFENIIAEKDNIIENQTDIISSLEEKINSLHFDLRVKEESIDKLQEDLIRTENSKFSSKKLDEEIKIKEKELQVMKKDYERLISELENRESAINEYENDLLKKSKEIFRLNIEIEESKRESSETRDKFLKKDKKIKELEEQLKVLEEKAENAKEEIKSNQLKKLTEAGNKEKTIISLKAALAEKTKSIDELNVKLLKAHEKIQQMKSMFKETGSNLKKKDSVIKNMRSMIDEKESEIAKIRHSIIDCQRRYSRPGRDLYSDIDEIKSDTLIDRLDQELREKCHIIEMQKEKIAHLHHDIEFCDKELKQIKAEMNKNVTTDESSIKLSEKNKGKEIESIKQGYTKILTEKENELSLLRQKIVNLSESLRSLEIQSTPASENKEKENQLRKTLKGKYNKKLLDLTEGFAAAEKKYEEEISLLNEKLSSLTEFSKNESPKSEKKQSKIKKLKEKYREAVADIGRLKAELLDLQQERSQDMQNFQHLHNANLIKIEENLRKLSRKAAGLTSTGASHPRTASNSDLNPENIIEEILNSSFLIETAINAFDRLSSDNDVLLQTVAANKTIIEELKQEINNLKSDFEPKKEEDFEKKQFESTSNDLENQSQLIDELQEEIKVLHKQLGELMNHSRKNEDLEGTLEESQKAVQNIKNEMMINEEKYKAIEDSLMKQNTIARAEVKRLKLVEEKAKLNNKALKDQVDVLQHKVKALEARLIEE